MYRLLDTAGEVKERRDQVRRPHYAAPELLATQRWTPSFGQVFVTAKVESGVMIQATLG